MDNKLSVGDIIQNGIQIGLKNFLPIFVNGILWVLTIWIPYLNVGTTIGLTGIIAKMGRGDAGTISMTEIFNPEYRKYMGEYFLAIGFQQIGILAGMVFLIIPGLVIGLAWIFAPLLVLDKGQSPLEAIKKSNEMTYGHKWTIFLGLLCLELVVMIGGGILFTLGGLAHKAVGGLLAFIVIVLVGPILMGAMGYIYNKLVARAS